MNEKKKIFVVDDDRRVRVMCASILTGRGYHVEDAGDASTALKALRRSAFDLVITDVNMPGLDGFDLWRSASEENPYLRDRFIFMTGNATPGVMEALRNGRKKYLIKPFRLVDLVSSVEAILSRPESERRRSRRHPSTLVCEVFEWETGLKLWKARLKDVSANGFRVVHGGSPLQPGTVVSMSFSLERFWDTSIQARVAWSRALNDRDAETGLVLKEGLPHPALKRFKGG